MISLQVVNDDLQESRWKNLTRNNEEAAACSMTAKIYMNLICIAGGEGFGWAFCFVFSIEVAQCGQEGRKADRMGGKEVGKTFSIEIVYIPQPAKLKGQQCVVYLSVAFDMKYFISGSAFERSS